MPPWVPRSETGWWIEIQTGVLADSQRARNTERLNSATTEQRAIVLDSARQYCHVYTMGRPSDYVLGRDLFPLCVALVLSVLIHYGVVSVLAGQLWAMRDVALTDAVVIAMELLEAPPQPARQEAPPVPRPARTLVKERPPLPPVESKPMPLPAPAVQEVIRNADAVMAPPSLPLPADAPSTSSQTSSRPPAALPTEKERETRGGPAVDEVRQSSTGDAPGAGSSSGLL